MTATNIIFSNKPETSDASIREGEYHFLTFSVDNNHFALEVFDLEMIPDMEGREILEINNKHFVKYEDSMVPLIDTTQFLRAAGSGDASPRKIAVFRYTTAHGMSHFLGIIADSISDCFSRSSTDQYFEIDPPLQYPKDFFDREINYRGRHITVLNPYNIPL